MDKRKIIEIQKEYINLIESSFKKEITDVKDFQTKEEYEKYALKAKSNSLWVGSFTRKITFFEDKFLKLLDGLDEHWRKYEQEINKYCLETGQNKVILWGDEPIVQLSPKLLLYYDTVLIPDSITNLGRNVIEAGNYRDALIYFSIINDIKEFITYDLDKPLIIFVNYKKSVASKFIDRKQNLAAKFVGSQSGEIAKKAFWEIINEKFEFEGIESLNSNIRRISESELNIKLNKDILSSFINFIIKDPSYLALSNSRGVFEFITSKRLMNRKLNYKDFINIFTILATMFSVYETREFNANSLNSTNLITDVHTPFSNYKYGEISKEYANLLEISEENLINYSLNQNFDWVNHIDIKKCLDIRKSGSFEEFRQILERQANQLKLSSFEDFPTIAKKYENDVRLQVEEQIAINKNRIADIKSKKKKSVVAFSITAGLTIASVAFPALLPLTLISAGYGLIAGANAKDLINELLTGKSELKELGNRSLSLVINKS